MRGAAAQAAATCAATKRLSNPHNDLSQSAEPGLVGVARRAQTRRGASSIATGASGTGDLPLPARHHTLAPAAHKGHACLDRCAHRLMRLASPPCAPRHRDCSAHHHPHKRADPQPPRPAAKMPSLLNSHPKTYGPGATTHHWLVPSTGAAGCRGRRLTAGAPRGGGASRTGGQRFLAPRRAPAAGPPRSLERRPCGAGGLRGRLALGAHRWRLALHCGAAGAHPSTLLTPARFPTRPSRPCPAAGSAATTTVSSASTT
jgi:hypothetical protein